MQDKHDVNEPQFGVDVGVNVEVGDGVCVEDIVPVDDCVMDIVPVDDCVEDIVSVDVGVIEDVAMLDFVDVEVAVTGGVDVGVLQEATLQSTTSVVLERVRTLSNNNRPVPLQTPPALVYSVGVWQDVVTFPPV